LHPKSSMQPARGLDA